MTSADLDRVAAAAADLARARQELDAAIRDAAASHSYSQVAGAAGLTKQRVHQIVKGA